MAPYSGDYSDSSLLKKISQGDQQAFRLLFDRYFDRLYQFLFNIVRSREVAEELAMDVFLKMWLARDMITEIKDLDGFLFRVAYNRSVDFFRAAGKDKQVNEAVLSTMHAGPEELADANLVAKEYEAVIRRAVDLLPPQRKEIFLRQQNEGLSYGEIATEMGISKNTVANTLVEARQFIRLYLAKHLDLVTLLIMLDVIHRRQ